MGGIRRDKELERGGVKGGEIRREEGLGGEEGGGDVGREEDSKGNVLLSQV